MIEVTGLSRHYGSKKAVDDVSFTVPSGQVTGLLGPNGAGKSTAMRAIVGLDRPTRGGATIDGVPYVRRRAPMRTLGALLDPTTVHPGRKSRTYLRALAASNGIGRARVDEVLGVTGLTEVAGSRIGTFRSACGSGSASPRPCSAARAR